MKKLLSVPAIVREVKTLDPDSAVNPTMINTMIDAKFISCVQCRTQRRIDFDRFQRELAALLGLPGDCFPRIRTIPDAWQYQHILGLGYSETFIRDSVRDCVIRSITIGNREYIALDYFEEPYVNRFSDPTLRPEPKRVIVPSSEIPMATPIMPKFKRARRLPLEPDNEGLIISAAGAGAPSDK